MEQAKLFENFQNNFLQYERMLKVALENYTAAKKLRDDNCEHSELVNKSDSHSGSYYNTSYTEQWVECVTCGAKSEKITKTTGHYD